MCAIHGVFGSVQSLGFSVALNEITNISGFAGFCLVVGFGGFWFCFLFVSSFFYTTLLQILQISEAWSGLSLTLVNVLCNIRRTGVTVTLPCVSTSSQSRFFLMWSDNSSLINAASQYSGTFYFCRRNKAFKRQTQL